MTFVNLSGLFCVFIIFLSIHDGESKNQTILRRIREDQDLSQFFSLIENNQILNLTLQFEQATLFAPTNQAFQRFKDRPENLVKYHASNIPQTLDQLGSQVLTLLDGNPPVWITRKKALRSNTDEIYINHAKVINKQSNVVAFVNKKRQVLHVIDAVLEPLLQLPTSSAEIYNPDAYLLLSQFEHFNLNNHKIRNFRKRVEDNVKNDIFKSDGRHTFFIPVDEGFEPAVRPQKIDQKVIDGHVIPNHVLFTEPTPMDVEYETLAFSDMIKVTVSFTNRLQDNKTSKLYVKSNTHNGDANHSNGVVIAEIVKANIPVRNGVVHLINRPLMVVDTTVSQFLQKKENGELEQFYNVIKEFGGDEFLNKLTSMSELTLLAPSNKAWSDPGVRLALNNSATVREILNLHLVPDQKLTLEQIVKHNQKEIFQVPTRAARKHIYFNVYRTPHGVQTLTVEGGGVNATVIEPDVAALNGVIHIIDKVLGIPYTTVRDKLATDPMLNQTYQLGERTDFNTQLKRPDRNYTYFVPRDYAWEVLAIQNPSGHKKLFMPEFSYHVRSILEKHLVISDNAYTMAELEELSKKDPTGVRLPTIRDSLLIKVKEHQKDMRASNNTNTSGYYLEWNGESVHVFRPDVQCTNGIIHVINTALIKESDIQVAFNSVSAAAYPHLAVTVISLIFLVLH